jgi:outer membrane protein OmpA-like peptidoglycan-associated protein
MTLGVRKMKLMGVAAVALLAMGASGCSSLPSVPDWVDPTTWFGDDEPVDNTATPDLASVPDKPAATPADEQQKVAESLAGDRTNANYSADALRGGTEPAAAPPADVVPTPVAQDAPVAPKAKTPAPAAPVQVAAVDRSVSQDPNGTAAPGTLPATQTGSPVAVATATPSAEAVTTAQLPEAAPVKPVKHKVTAKPVQVAVATPAPQRFSEAAPIPQTPVATISPSDAELGFKPSSAPPLDASVTQFVAAPIVDRYRSTAAAAGLHSSAPTTFAAATPVHRIRHHHAKSANGVAMGGPERMEGKVVANFDALNGAAQPSVVANAVGGGAAVVYFPNDTVGLNAEARLQVRATVEQFRAAGGQGYVRVVGHSSSRTPNMSAEKHLELIFKKSQDRANAVARELIRVGIPADHVLVEAVGDTQPVYYESMPKGEDGNRRAEIFLQG